MEQFSLGVCCFDGSIKLEQLSSFTVVSVVLVISVMLMVSVTVFLHSNWDKGIGGISGVSGITGVSGISGVSGSFLRKVLLP